jgi:hypothetical protein
VLPQTRTARIHVHGHACMFIFEEKLWNATENIWQKFNKQEVMHVNTCNFLLTFLLLNGVPSKASSSYPSSCCSNISRNSRFRASVPVFDDNFPVSTGQKQFIYYMAVQSIRKMQNFDWFVHKRSENQQYGLSH